MKNKTFGQIVIMLLILGLLMIISGLICQIVKMNKDYKELYKNSYMIKQQNDEMWERYYNMCDYSVEQSL